MLYQKYGNLSISLQPHSFKEGLKVLIESILSGLSAFGIIIIHSGHSLLDANISFSMNRKKIYTLIISSTIVAVADIFIQCLLIHLYNIQYNYIQTVVSALFGAYLIPFVKTLTASIPLTNVSKDWQGNINWKTRLGASIPNVIFCWFAIDLVGIGRKFILSGIELLGIFNIQILSSAIFGWSYRIGFNTANLGRKIILDLLYTHLVTLGRQQGHYLSYPDCSNNKINLQTSVAEFRAGTFGKRWLVLNQMAKTSDPVTGAITQAIL